LESPAVAEGPNISRNLNENQALGGEAGAEDIEGERSGGLGEPRRNCLAPQGL
jgi:hypothetical protein